MKRLKHAIKSSTLLRARMTMKLIDARNDGFRSGNVFPIMNSIWEMTYVKVGHWNNWTSGIPNLCRAARARHVR
jgi:hypothetical protein